MLVKKGLKILFDFCLLFYLQAIILGGKNY